MERAKRAAHLAVNSSETDLLPSSDPNSSATAAAPPLDEPWSVQRGESLRHPSVFTPFRALCMKLAFSKG